MIAPVFSSRTEIHRNANRPLPDSDALQRALTAVLSPNSRLELLERQPNVGASTFPSEIMHCRLANGEELRLFCKYSSGQTQDNFGHRGGMAYEAAVYRELLQPQCRTVPRFYGLHSDPETEATWLFLEYLEGGTPVRSLEPPLDGAALTLAARWIGAFHAANESLAIAQVPAWVTQYRAEYYIGWAKRTAHFAGDLHELGLVESLTASRRAKIFTGDIHQTYPWLRTVCDRFVENVGLLTDAPQTLIHGEYYPANILFHREMVYPIDWESTAIAVGEIDLAMLTEGWPAEIARQCELEYQRARWPEMVPPEFPRRLALACLYVNFRWLGDLKFRRLDWRFAHLRSIAEQLEFI